MNKYLYKDIHMYIFRRSHSGSRVATVREKYLEKEIFSRSGKSQGILWMAGKFRKDLENQGKVRDFENKWLWQAVFRKFIQFVQEGK